MTSIATAGLPLFAQNQTELPFFRVPRKRGCGPRITQNHIDILISALYNRGWVKSEALGAKTEPDKRLLRAIVEAACGHIISGQAGYRLAFQATSDEHRTFVSWFRHQIEKMQRRVVETERVYHSKAVPRCLEERIRKSRPAA